MGGRFVLPGDDPVQNLAEEAQLLQNAAAGPCVRFYINRSCVIMGRNNRPQDWVHLDNVRAAGIPLLRRLTGGGSVYHDTDTLNYVFVLPRALYERSRRGIPLMDFFRSFIIEALAPLGLELGRAGLSDLVLHGRKVSGNAARLTRDGVLFHGTLLLKVDYDAMERFLPVPPDRPGVSHRRHVTSLAQEGLAHNKEALMDALARVAVARFSADNPK